jgi:phosphate starvation-inducible protein PhoH
MSTKTATKKARQVVKHQHNAFCPKTVKPLTFNQAKAFRGWYEGSDLVMHGFAGTGKTYIAFALALQALTEHECQQVIIMRSAVPTRDIGFMPGNEREKLRVYEGPYSKIVSDLYGRGDAYDILKTKGQLEFTSTSFIRGLTLDDTVVIVDEAQNCSLHELDSIVTRAGENTRVIFCGDTRQSDLLKTTDRSGFVNFMKVLDATGDYERVEFETQDIVRSPKVKRYLIAKDSLGL